jgi:hypothetical protein
MDHTTGDRVPTEVWPRSMTTTTITHRQALAEARRRYDELYAALLATAEGDERAKFERIYTRGNAALAEQTPSDGRLSGDATEAFRAYMNAAANGDADAQFAWLKMMPRVIAEVAAGVEPPLVFQPVVWTSYDAFLNTTLQQFDHQILSQRVSDVRVSYVVTTEMLDAVHNRKIVAPQHWLIAEGVTLRWSWPRRTERADHNRQSTLALAA